MVLSISFFTHLNEKTSKLSTFALNSLQKPTLFSTINEQPIVNPYIVIAEQ